MNYLALLISSERDLTPDGGGAAEMTAYLDFTPPRRIGHPGR